jgi:hypothetical protein
MSLLRADEIAFAHTPGVDPEKINVLEAVERRYALYAVNSCIVLCSSFRTLLFDLCSMHDLKSKKHQISCAKSEEIIDQCAKGAHQYRSLAKY